MPWRVVLVGAIGVIVFDTVASTASKLLEFEYGLATPGSLVIYGLVGYAAARRSGTHRAATFAGVAVSLVEGTAGWAVSWLIGPGRFNEEQVPFAVLVAMVLVSTALLGALFGWLGGRFALRSSRSRLA